MATEDEILQFGVEVDSKKAIADFTKLQKSITGRLRYIDKESARLGKVSGKIWKNLGKGVRNTYVDAINDSEKAFKHSVTQQTRLQTTQINLQKEYRTALQATEALKQKIASAKDDKGQMEVLKKQLLDQNAQVAKIRDTWRDAKEELSDYEKLQKDAAGQYEKMREDLESNLDMKELAEGLKEGGEKLRAPMKALLNNDLPEAAEATAKLIGQGMISGMRLGAKLLRGKEKPDGTGGNGKLMKAAAGGLEKAAGKFARLAPMFGVIVDGLKEALQVFLKLDAKVKDFNASITESSDSARFLAARGGDVSAAYGDVRNQLEKVRNAAHSLENLKLGITPEQHAQVLNALAQEGQGMFEISEAARKAGMPVEDLSNSIVQSSIAFSRHMGVSVGEITQLTSQMTTDIGINLDQTDEKLGMLSRTAAESGMATNKFFNILRGMSDDMTLFNTRMEDSARLLKQLGKVMGPREAQKFMQSIQGFMKGQDIESRIKLSLMAGPDKTKDIMQKDTDRRMGEMVTDLKLNVAQGKELVDAIHKSPDATVRVLAKNNDLTSAQTSAILDASITQELLNKGDVVSLATAIKDASPTATMEMLDAASMKLTGKKLDQLDGTAKLGVMKAVGLTEEMLQSRKKLGLGLDLMKEKLVNKLKAGDKLTEEDQDLLKKLNINATDSNAASMLAGTAQKNIQDALSKAAQNELSGSKDALDLQEAIAGETKSMNEKLGIISNFLTNKLVNVLGPTGAAVAGGAVEVAGGAAKMGIEMALGAKARSVATKALPQILGGGATAAAETAAVAAAEGAAVPAATAAGTALTGAGVAAGAAIAAAGVAAAGGLYAAYDQASKLSKESGEEGIWESLKDAWKGPAKATTREEYDKKYGKPAAATVAPATPGGTPAAPTAAPLADIKTGIGQVVEGLKSTGITPVIEALREQHEATLTDGFGVLAGILRRDVKLNKSFVTNELGPMVEKSVLDAVRVALVEYSLYKDMSSAALTSALKAGGGDAKGFVAGKVEAATAHAAGGFVTGKNPDGTAKVIKAPAGEMPTTIGAGETIVPKGGKTGGGGTAVTVNVNGIGGSDLANMVKVAATNAIYEYKRREHLN